MLWHDHSKMSDKHAFLSPSKYHWLQYDANKLTDSFFGYMAIQRGTELHAFAKEAIRLGIPLGANDETLAMYVNDCISFGMKPEMPLVYSDNCFGTCDSIIFDKGLLRIHDLKTGVTPASMLQLQIYAALFCLEYNKKPNKINTELRIYQNGKVSQFEPDPSDTESIMDKIVSSDSIIDNLRKENGYG